MYSPYLLGTRHAVVGSRSSSGPTRFEGQAGSDARNDPAWAPFGRGSRSCIGFALGANGDDPHPVALAQRIDIDLVSTEIPAPCGIVVSRPSGGLPATIKLLI